MYSGAYVEIVQDFSNGKVVSYCRVCNFRHVSARKHAGRTCQNYKQFELIIFRAVVRYLFANLNRSNYVIVRQLCVVRRGSWVETSHVPGLARARACVGGVFHSL